MNSPLLPHNPIVQECTDSILQDFNSLVRKMFSEPSIETIKEIKQAIKNLSPDDIDEVQEQIMLLTLNSLSSKLASIFDGPLGQVMDGRHSLTIALTLVVLIVNSQSNGPSPFDHISKTEWYTILRKTAQESLVQMLDGLPPHLFDGEKSPLCN